MNRTALIAVVLTLAPSASGLASGPATRPDAGWSHWRGPEGTGATPTGNPPVKWAEGTNVRWKVEIPGEGYSSPVAVGDRLYLMTAVKTDRTPAGDAPVAPQAAPDAGAGASLGASPVPGAPAVLGQDGGRGRGGRDGGRRRGGMRAGKPTNIYDFKVMALDRSTGAAVWTTTVTEEVPHEGIHRTASFASAAPVTDGAFIYAFFGSRGLYCLDLDGTVKWSVDPGDQTTRNSFGEGATPAVHGNVLVFPWDHEGDSFIAAVDTRTGKEIWRKARDERTNWTSPVIVEVNGAAQVVLAGTTASISYDLKSGEEIWRCSGMTGNVVPTPVVGHGMIYLLSGFRGASLQAVKLDAAKGDITGGEAIAWSYERDTPYIPSPVLSGRRLYFLKGTAGMISCLDAVTGESLYDGERLETASIYASPVAAAGRIYIADREGTTIVLEDGPEPKVLATNTIDEGINCTPAIVGEDMYLRGTKHLYCVSRQ